MATGTGFGFGAGGGDTAFLTGTTESESESFDFELTDESFLLGAEPDDISESAFSARISLS